VIDLERIAIEITAAVLLIVGTVLYLEHRGAAKCVAADAAAVQQQQTHKAVKSATDAQTINQEAKTYAQALLDPIAAPVVRVRYLPARTVPSPRPAGPLPASACLPGPSPPDPVPGPDIGRPLVQLGHDADSQVSALWDYIDRVCRVR
jgi:hypothetical protein